MARIYELSTRISAVSRGEGRSATAAAAYRACCSIECEREGRTHDYRRKSGLEVAEIVVPESAPAWAKDRGKLWNGAEARERNKDARAKTVDKANARPAREFLFTFPAELSQGGRLNAARLIALHLVTTHGMAADFAIHQPGREGDERNFHCHMLTTTRRMTAKGLGEKVREWDDLKGGAKLAKELRAMIAATLNAELAAEGKASVVHVEHRSFKARGSGQVATRHQGPERTHQARRKQAAERREWFDQVQRDQTERHGQEIAALRARQAFNLQAKAGELRQRGREAAKAIRRDLDAARAADRPPERLRRVFLLVTGRAGQEAAERQARDVQRVQAAKGRLAEVRAEIRAERSAYMASQGNERASLVERHGGENVQLQHALKAREALDRSAESVARREQVQDRQQEYQQERGHSRGRTISEMRL